MGNHSLICIVRLIVGGQITPQPISIQWIELDCSNKSEILADCNETFSSCAANTNNTSLAHSYRCTAKYFGLSNYSDVIANQTGRLFLATSIIYVFVSQLIVPHLWTKQSPVLTFLQQKLQPLRTPLFLPPSPPQTLILPSFTVLLQTLHLLLSPPCPALPPSLPTLG